jgi:hypothetical protein
MTTIEFWESELNAGKYVFFPKGKLIQTQWYDGLVFGHLESQDTVFFVDFIFEDETKRRWFWGFLVQVSKLSDPEDQALLHLWLERSRREFVWPVEEFEVAKIKILKLRALNDYCILIQADAGLASIIASKVVSRPKIEAHSMGIEESYSLSDAQRKTTHDFFSTLLE